jgi:hypothetical protein
MSSAFVALLELGWHSRKGRISLIFAFFFRFRDGFLYDFAFNDAKTTGKPRNITIEHIKHARQCAFGA